jgi:TP901 family phage tail tape measure protein
MAILVKIRVDDRGNVAIEKLGKNANRATKQIGDLGSVMGKVFGAAGAFYGLWQLIEGLKQATREANRYQDQMTKLQVIAGVNNKEFSNLSKEFRNLSLNTEHSATSISKAALELSKMGFEGSKLEKILPNALDLATYAGEDLTFTAVNLGRVLNAFGKDADQSANIANAMGRVLNLTALDFKDFIEAMSYSAPVAKNLGYSFEETAAMIGLLSNRSIIGSRAGTGLKNSMLRLLAPTEASANALKKSATEGGSLVQKFEAMKSAGLDVADMLEQFHMIALPTALTMKDTTDEAAKLTRELMNMGFSVEEAAKQIREMSNVAQWKEVWNSIVDVGIALNEAFGDNQRTLAQNLKEEFIELAKWVKRNESDIRAFGSAVVEGAKVMARFANFVLQNGPTIAAIFATLWGAGKINDITKFFKVMSSGKGAILGLSGSAEVLARGLGSVLSRVTLIGIGFEVALGAMNLYFDSLDKRRKKQAENVDDWNSDEHLKLLKDLAIAQKQYNDALKGAGGSTKDMATKLFFSDKLKKATSAYKKAYGSTDHVSSYEATLGVITNIETLRAKKEADPLGGSGSSTSGSTKTKTKKEKEKDLMKLGVLGLLDFESAYETGSTYGQGVKGRGFRFDARTGEVDTRAYLPTGDDVDLSGVEKAIADQKKKPEDYVKDFFEAEEARRKIEEDAAKDDADWAEQRRQNIQTVFDFTTSTMLQTFDIISQFQEMKLQEDLLRLEKEKQAIADRYATEERLAGNNVFKKALLAKKFANDQKKIDDEMERKRDEAARKSKTVAIFEAIVQGAVAVVNAIKAGSSMGPWGAAAFAAITAGLVAAQIGVIAAANFRSGGRVYGEGNGTSDSVIAKVSRGEYIVDSDTVRKLGGFEALESLLDRGSNSERSINLYVDNYIGSKEYTRELIEQFREELSR